MNFDNIKNEQLDILGEIGNIGAGNALTSLSAMLSKRIDMSTPVVNMVDIKNIAEIVGGPEQQVIGILFDLEADLDGMMLFMLEKKFAKHILSDLFGKSPDESDDGKISEMDESALKEVGNIMVGAYLGAIAQMTNLKISFSVPYFQMDMAGAMLNVPASQFGAIGDKVLVIQEEFYGEKDVINSFMILMPTADSLKKISDAIGLGL